MSDSEFLLSVARLLGRLRDDARSQEDEKLYDRIVDDIERLKSMAERLENDERYPKVRP
jgi:hypothetical protein